MSLQDRLEHCQSVLDVEVKENQRREVVIWRQETALGRLKAKIAKLKNWAERIVIYSAME
jgi:DNA gyrase inhibitor GyrI